MFVRNAALFLALAVGSSSAFVSAPSQPRIHQTTTLRAETESETESALVKEIKVAVRLQLVSCC